MDHHYEDIVLLERYIERSLNEDEILTVERRLLEDPSLRELYNQEQLLVKGIRFTHLKTRLEELKDLEEHLPMVETEENTARIVPLTSYWKAVAIAATLVVSVGAYLFINRAVAPADLYAEYFQPYPNIIETIRRSTHARNPRADAFASYERGDYAGAAKGFIELLKMKQEPGILLLLGNAHLKLGNTTEALDNFITLSKDSGDWKRPAKWYMGLCYLKMENKEAARVLFEEIAAENSSYQGKAKELLRKLD